MALLERRQATLDANELCCKCQRAIGGPPGLPNGLGHGVEIATFYLFPTGNAFHGACLLEVVREGAPAAQAARINGLLLRLEQVQLFLHTLLNPHPSFCAPSLVHCASLLPATPAACPPLPSQARSSVQGCPLFVHRAALSLWFLLCCVQLQPTHVVLWR